MQFSLELLRMMLPCFSSWEELFFKHRGLLGGPPLSCSDQLDVQGLWRCHGNSQPVTGHVTDGTCEWWVDNPKVNQTVSPPPRSMLLKKLSSAGIRGRKYSWDCILVHGPKPNAQKGAKKNICNELVKKFLGL